MRQILPLEPEFEILVIPYKEVTKASIPANWRRDILSIHKVPVMKLTFLYFDYGTTGVVSPEDGRHDDESSCKNFSQFPVTC